MKHFVTNLFLLAAAILSGCATITTGTDQKLTVITEKNVKGAKCTLVDVEGRVSTIMETPGVVSVHKGDGPITITCEKEHFKTVVMEVEEAVHGATLGNILIGGGIGIIIDAASGAAQKYPDQVVVWMEPEEWASETDQLEWIEAKKAYDEKLQMDKEALQASRNDVFGP